MDVISIFVKKKIDVTGFEVKVYADRVPIRQSGLQKLFWNTLSAVMGWMRLRFARD